MKSKSCKKIFYSGQITRPENGLEGHNGNHFLGNSNISRHKM